MPLDTKPNLTNRKFEQLNAETLNLSGITSIYGCLSIKPLGIIDSCNNYMMSGVTMFATPRNTLNSIYIGQNSGNGNNGNSIIAIGSSVLDVNLGNCNIGIGNCSLNKNLGGSNNIGIGDGSLSGNTTGSGNIGLGLKSSFCNTIGCDNIAIGINSLLCNSSGDLNVAIGCNSLCKNSTGIHNIGIGGDALRGNNSSKNISIGYSSLKTGTLSCDSIAIGECSMNIVNACNSIAIGSLSASQIGTSNQNISIGSQSLYGTISSISSCNIAIGGCSMYCNNSGNNNIAMGMLSLRSNNNGNNNIALGCASLYSNTNGCNNIAFGLCSNYSNITGNGNLSIGVSSLLSNTIGNYNLALGELSLRSNTVGCDNVGLGLCSLYSNVSGNSNIAIGNLSLRSNVGGCDNIGFGNYTLYANTVGCNNIAMGFCSLCCNVSGNNNFAAGYASLRYNCCGNDNVALGYQSLNSNVSGSQNIGFGRLTLFSNTIGGCNVGIGAFSLYSNTCGSFNVGVGLSTLQNNICGTFNVALGNSTLFYNTYGAANTGVGSNSLQNNTIGDYNTAIGHEALENNISGDYNIAIGVCAGSMLCQISGENQAGCCNVFIGIGTESLASNNVNQIVIGARAIGAGSNTVVLGNNHITTSVFKGNIKLHTFPTTGSPSDSVLVWNSIDKCIKRITIGGITSGSTVTANNGLNKIENNVRLGGALTGDTSITGAYTLGLNNLILNLTGSTAVNISGPTKLLSTPSTGVNTDSILVWNSSDKCIKSICKNIITTGLVTGATSSTDNAIARFDGTTGKLIQNSGVVIDDNGNINMPSKEIKGVGIEVVSSLPTTNNFTGRQVTYLSRPYIWNGSSWISDTSTFQGYDRCTFIQNNAVIMNTNPFGGRKLYINSVDNAMFAANKRFSVTVTTHLISYSGETYPKLNPDYISSYSVSGSGVNFVVIGNPLDIVVYIDDNLCTEVVTPTTQYTYTYNSGNLVFGNVVTGTIYVYPERTIPQYLDSPISSTLFNGSGFDGSYEGGFSVNIGYYLKIKIDASVNKKEDFYNIIGYPYGNLYLSYYYNYAPDSAFLRVYNRNYRPGVIGWKLYDFQNFINDNTSTSFIQKNTNNVDFGRTSMEIIVISHSSHSTMVTEVDWELQRPNLSKTSPTVTKFGPQLIYYPFTVDELLTANQLKITSTTTGAGTDSILVWNPTDKCVKSITCSCVNAGNITTANNGLTKSGQNVRLGGALTGDTSITGAYTLGLNNTILNLTGTSAVNISGPTKLLSTPATGTGTDGILVWNSTDKCVKQVSSVNCATNATTAVNSTCLNGQLASYYAVATHGHGNITNAGCLGTISGCVLVTSTGGCIVAASSVNCATNATTAVNSTCLNGQLASYYSVATHGHGNVNNGGCLGTTSGCTLTTSTNGCIIATSFVNCAKNATNAVNSTCLNGQLASYYAVASNVICSANNGLNKIGNNVRLGGALTGNTSITGAYTLGFSNTYINITGSSGVNISGPTRLVTTPSTGAGTDGILVWNSTDKCVKTITCACIIGGAITTANNGLNKVGSNVRLGGALTGNTSITGAYTLNFSSGSKINSNLGYQISGVTILKTGKNTLNSLYVGCYAGPITDNSSDEYNSSIGIGIGSYVLNSITTGSDNLAIGSSSLRFTSSGCYNIGIGTLALWGNNTGCSNIAIGHYSQKNGGMMNDNVSIGNRTLYYGIGSCNVAIGSCSGYNSCGTGNIFIGFESGGNSNSSNKLYIANNANCNLIFGDFTGNTVTLPWLKLCETPSVGASGDNILVWNSTDKCVKKINYSGVTSGLTNTYLKLDQSIPQTIVGTLQQKSEAQHEVTTVGTKPALQTIYYSNDAVANEVRFGGIMSCNLFFGKSSGCVVTTGVNNLSFGYLNLRFLTTGCGNIAIGSCVLNSNCVGCTNIGIGNSTLVLNTTGCGNVGIGSGALNLNSTGCDNTVIGDNALSTNTLGCNNIAVGRFAGRYIANGSSSNCLSNNSVYLGYNTKSLTNSDINEIVIGYNTTGAGSNTVTLGNDDITTSVFKGNIKLPTTPSSGNLSDSVLLWNSTDKCVKSIPISSITSGSTGGEVNTASNLGSGSGIYSSKSGVDLRFKSLKAGSNISLTSTTDEITICSTGGGGISTANNGLNVVGTNVRLGGALTGNTSITGAYTLNFCSGSMINSDSGYYSKNTILLRTDNNQGIYLGSNSGNLSNPYQNIYIGANAGYSNTSGYGNVFIGVEAGYSNVSGCSNVFIGCSAGFYETGSNKLYISNGEDFDLITGNFLTKNLVLPKVCLCETPSSGSVSTDKILVWNSSDKCVKTLNSSFCTKQDKNLVFTNQSGFSWSASTAYSGYGYEANITTNGVTSSDIATVIFGHTEAVSGNYSPISITSTDRVKIFAKVNTAITIPTIIIIKV